MSNHTSNQTNEPSRLELYKAGKLEERGSHRLRNTPVLEEAVPEVTESAGLRPEIVVLTLLVVALLVITAIAL